MSIETILFLALFILLPLLERWLRSRRQQSEGPPQRAPQRPRRAPQRPPPPAPARQASIPVEVSPPPPAAVPPLPAAPAAQRSPRPQTPARAARRAARRRNVAEDLRHPSSLRRAVVLMTVLGPCRSAAPHEWGS